MAKKTSGSKTSRSTTGKAAGSRAKKAGPPGINQGAATNPVGIMDTTLRDGHQCLLATRMRMEDMEPVLPTMAKAGFAVMEVWGGATFDATHRFLAECPWERLATFRKAFPDTPLQMLLRGQNLVGYRHYADDLVDEFIARAAETGMDRFRVFDALNDLRNMERSFKAIDKAGKHIQGTVCYTLTGPRMGGDIYNLAYFIDKAKALADMGAHSICLKDMAGLLAPTDAYELIGALKQAVDLPLQLHTHDTAGFSSMTALKAVEAGVDIIDCALAPLALRTSQPAVEPLLVSLQGTDRDPGIELAPLIEVGNHFEKVGIKYKDLLDDTKMATIDAGVLVHQIPGGMMSNLVNQLRGAGAVDRLPEVLKELPQTRADLGFPPLVTPSSQIIGTQAVMNVLFGRYERITEQVKDYAAGLYGRPPVPMDKAVQKKCMVGHKRKKPITKRPADLLDPELKKARAEIADITSDPLDVLTYAIYPTTGRKFLSWKYGLEPIPDALKAKTEEEALAEQALVQKAREGLLVEAPEPEAVPDRSAAVRAFNVFVDGEYFKIDVDPADGQSILAGAPAMAAPAQATAAPGAPARPAPAPPPPAAAPAGGGPGAITAPMSGLIIEYRVKAGDKVKAGDVLVIFEAMKMQNEIPATSDGTVESVAQKDGDEVSQGATLLVVAS